MTAPGYAHTQYAPFALVVYAVAAAEFVGAWFAARGHPAVPATLAASGVLLIALAASFHHLTVEDAGDALVVRFGPLPLFRRSVRYDDIERAEVGRTTLADGWGVHMSPRGGWVWNIWGRDCVVLHTRGGGVWRVGTDDAAGLARFLGGRLADARAAP